MLFSLKTLLPTLVVASAAPLALANCELEYVVFNADTDTAVGLLEDQLDSHGYYCIPDYKVNFQARPTPNCPTTESAEMMLEGPVSDSRTENISPYTVFSERSSGDILGRDLLPGTYAIYSDIYSKDHLQGHLVVNRGFDFEAKFCHAPAPVMKKGYVKVVNKAPKFGTCQTPVWVGIHDGGFDTYDRNKPITKQFERLVEDGNNAPITKKFASTPGTVWDGTVGDGPICAGETAFLPFEIKIEPGTKLFFSYASMILPSNDAFVSNGNPEANPVFSEKGDFIPVTINSLGDMALDGGTEVNDEIPKNTAFFGQVAPDTGKDEHGVVTLHPGFNAKGGNGILDSPRFSNADFTVKDYQFMEVSVHLGEKPDMCKLEFILHDADKDKALRPLEEVEYIRHNQFNIQARPTAECPTTLSADMSLRGPIDTDRVENAGPYMIFGDSQGNIFGRDYKEGTYTIYAEIYSKRNLRGDLVVRRQFRFEIKDDRRHLRGST